VPDKTLAWIRQLPEMESLLDKDAKLVYENCGLDVFIAIWEALPSISIHVSSKPLDRLRRLYIKKFFNGSNQKELCLLLDCSERFFYDTLEAEHKNRPRGNQLDLFAPIPSDTPDNS
jgi:hypothetical protein